MSYAILDPRQYGDRRKMLLNKLMNQFQQQGGGGYGGGHMGMPGMSFGVGAGMPFRTSNSAAPRMSRISLTNQFQGNERGMGAAFGRAAAGEHSDFRGQSLDPRLVGAPSQPGGSASPPSMPFPGAPTPPQATPARSPVAPAPAPSSAPRAESTTVPQSIPFGDPTMPQVQPSIPTAQSTNNSTVGTRTFGGGANAGGSSSITDAPIHVGNGIYVDPKTGQIVSSPLTQPILGAGSRLAMAY